MDDAVDEDFEWRGVRRPAKPGRPRGVLNRAPIVLKVSEDVARGPERLPDISELIATQLRLVAAAQVSVTERLEKKGATMREIADLSGALDKAMAAVSRAAQAEADVLKRMSAAQHLEAAIRRCEEQEPGVRALIIRRLKSIEDKPAAPRTATDAISALSDEE